MFVQSVSLLATACLCEFARGRENGRNSALRRYAASMMANGDLSTAATAVFEACGPMDQRFRHAARP